MPDNSIDYFVSEVKASPLIHLKKLRIARNEFLLQEGEIERNIYIIESGALRVFYLTEKEEHTIRLGYKNSIINGLSSFYSEKPSEFYVQAIKESQLLVLSKKDFRSFFNETEERKLQYRTLLESFVLQQTEREIDLLTSSPAKRLERVLTRSPHVFQEIPLKYIASYLRMSPETLSRLK